MSEVILQPGGRRYPVRDDQTLLDAALAAGIPMPRSCRNGTCRTCRCRVLDGSAVHTIEWPGLSREEKAQGWILPCVAKAASETLVLDLREV